MRRGIGYSKAQIADALNVRYESIPLKKSAIATGFRG